MATASASIEQILSLVRELSHESRIVLVQRILQMFLPASEPVARTNGQASPYFSQHPQRHQMLQEEAAFDGMLEQLRVDYLDQYVAIHQGKLIDHDQDTDLLIKRTEETLPKQIVLIRKVLNKPQPLLVFRSPRFANNLTRRF